VHDTGYTGRIEIPSDWLTHNMPNEMEALAKTDYLDFDHQVVQEFIRAHIGNEQDKTQIALKLYYAVRDQIRYDPYRVEMSVAGLRASSALEQGYGWCVPKAVLLAACCRAQGIPAKLGFADVKNHLTSQRLRESMGTDVFAWHGYTSIFLNGKWLKATPAFNKELCEKANIFPLEFTGHEDSIYHEFNRDGQKHMEYMRHRGEFNDLPLQEMIETFTQLYNFDQTSDEPVSGNFTNDVENEVQFDL
jgi:hypothetical protein